MYNNKLIFGKNELTHVVGVEPDDGRLIIFQEINGEVKQTFIDNKYWILTDRKVSSKMSELKGDQHYKYIATFDTIEEQRNVRGILKKNNIDKYDIYNSKEASMVYNGITYFKGMKPQDVSVLSFDIETTGLVHDKNSKVLLISNTFRKNGKITKRLFAYDDYNSDREMFEDWSAWVRELNPAIILGHNILGYDLGYLNYCANRNYARLSLGRDGSDLQIDKYESNFRVDGNQDLQYYNASIWGREIVDTMFLARRYDIGKKYESYGLKAIIKHEGLEKKDRQFYDAGEIRNNYQNPEEWAKIKAYAIDDADDALALYDLMIPATFYFTQSVSKPFQVMINSATGSQINNMMVRSYLQDGYSIAKADEKVSYQGAISFGIPGIYTNCYKQDVSSLYPSIMRQYQVYSKEKDPNKHFIQMVEYFTVERLKNKKLAKETGDQYYKDLEQSQKIAINSKYGFLGAPGLNYNYPDGADFITKSGREILNKAIVFATGHDVTYWLDKVGE